MIGLLLTVQCSTIEEKICESYDECSTLSAYCAFAYVDGDDNPVFKCKCLDGYDHNEGLAEFMANDGFNYTSECAYVSGLRELKV